MNDGFCETTLHPVKKCVKNSFFEADVPVADICDRMRASMHNVVASNTSIVECSYSGEREIIRNEDIRNASAKRNKLPLPRKCSSLSAEQGDGMQENLKSMESVEERADRLKKLGVVAGSFEDLGKMYIECGYTQDISPLCTAFPGECDVYCHQVKHYVPLAMVPLLTPRHFKHPTFEGHAVCQIDCDFGCQRTNAVDDNEFVRTIQAFRVEENLASA